MTTNRPIGVKQWSLLLALSLGVAACVILKWQQVYQGRNNYSFASDVYPGPSGKVYMSGNLDQGEMFVAAYGGDGSLLWDQPYSLADEDASFFRWGTASMVEDADGNLFAVKAVSDPSPALMLKFDTSGAPIHGWSTQYGYVEAEIKLGPDGNLYVSDPGGSKLEVFDRFGNALWRFSTGGPLQVIKGSSALAFWTDSIVLLSQDTLRVFDGAGNLIDSVMASDLLFDRFHGVAVRGYQLMLITQVGQEIEWVTVNELLQVSTRFLLQDGEPDHVLLSVQGDNACVSLTDFGLDADENKSVIVSSLKLDGTLAWQTSILSQAAEWGYPMLKAAQRDCYFGVAEYISSEKAHSFIQRFKADGSTGDRIIVRDNAMEDFAVQGSSIYQVGVTGTYDGTVTEATLTKHQRY